jgi:sugar lactone lactonase YvrE
MAIESAVMFRKVGRIACLVLLVGLLQSVSAKAQLPIKAPARVTTGSIIPFNHGSTGSWIQIYSMKEDPLHGHIVMLDSAASNIYDIAPGASQPSLIVGPEPAKTNSDCSALESKGTYWNAAIAFDKWDNMYVTDRYGASVQFCRVPYNASSGTWIFSTSTLWKGPTYTNSSGQQSAIPPQDLQVGDDGVTFYVSTSSTSSIFKYQVDENGNVVAGSVTALATGLEANPTQLVVDHAGNLYFVENQGAYPNNVHGIREIAAGSPTIVGDGSGSAESALPRIDQGGWNGITGMFIDKQGNMYFGSANNPQYGGNADGVFMIPNEGTPAKPNLVWTDTVMVSPVDGGYPPLVDSRGLLWIATSYYNDWAPAGLNGPTCDTTSVATADATCLDSTIVIWKPGALNLGSTPVGGATAVPITAYAEASGGGSLTLTAKNSFTEGETVTITAKSTDPLSALNGMSFYVSGTGLTSTAFQIASSTLAAGANGSTSATVSVNQTQAIYFMFNQPTTISNVALAQPSNASFLNVANSPMLTNPAPSNPVQPCTAGTTYPAFTSNMTTTNAYSWCPYYVQLNTTMAGPVEGEVQLFDSNNNVIAGSNAYLSGTGQGAAVSAVSSATVQSIASGLNDPMQVAADPWGNTYVADSALKAIEKYPAGTTSPTSGKVLGTGLSAPTGVAVDGVGNLYIGDSGNIIEIPFVNDALATSQQTTLASGLGNHLNLAADGQGNIFVADQDKKQVVEIPNPQTALMLAGEGGIPIVLGSSAGFTGPTAVATDSSGNVWVADGGRLWEISMPFGGANEVISSGLQSPVTGLAVDPSGSVFAAGATGLVWIPYSTATGTLNINGQVLVTGGLGSSPAIPWGVALDGSQNVYATYGSGSTAGLGQLGIGGTFNFNSYGEVNPNVPFEVDAQMLNLGNLPLMISDDPTVDLPTGANAADFAVAPATLNSPVCSATTSTPPGGSCYLGMVLQAPAAGSVAATIPVMSNAVNATSGVNLTVSGNVIQDPRPATTATIKIAAATGTGCSGTLTYPGCTTIQVVVAAGAGFGTPTGTVTLSVGSLNGNLPRQTLTLDSTGTATFPYNPAKNSSLLGGTYTVNADYAGAGTGGTTQNTCSGSTPCFAGTAAKSTFTIARAVPTFTLGIPVTNSQCLNTTTLTNGSPSSNCANNPKYVTVWAGNTFVQWTNPVYLSTIVSSAVGTPTGTVTFTQNGAPVDPTQGVNGALALNGTGVSTFALQNLNLGAYNMSAVYSGDVNYAPQTLSVATFYDIVPSVQITAPSGALSITPGTPAQVTLTLTPLVGFSGSVSLECNSSDAPVKLAATTPSTTLPEFSECTFAYANPSTGTSPVGQSGPTSSTIVVTISTNVAVNGGSSASIARQSPWTLAGLFGLGLAGLIAGRKRLYRSMAVICIAIMLSGFLVGITACTNAGYSTPPPPPAAATPAGSYDVQIVTYNPTNLTQNSLTAPMFTLPLSVQ